MERLLPVHETQMLTYLKLTGLPVALLFNFNVTRLHSVMRRPSRKFPPHCQPFSALSAVSAFQP